MKNIDLFKLVIRTLEKELQRQNSEEYQSFIEWSVTELAQIGPSLFEDYYISALFELMNDLGYSDRVQHLYNEIEAILNRELTTAQIKEHKNIKHSIN